MPIPERAAPPLRTALFLSPHLDDVVFSCGGTLAALAANGWRTILCTAFTGSVAEPTGFALACQTDKGLPRGADYMAVRRREDLEAAAILRASEARHWGLLEAPHRGYGSASELFSGLRHDDAVWAQLVEPIRNVLRELEPEIVFVPQALGEHADHLQLVRGFLATVWPGPVHWYRDTPYAIRRPDAPRSALIPRAGRNITEALSSDAMERKIAACAAYQTQIPFQFGGLSSLRDQLVTLAASEGGHAHAERFWVTP